MGLYHKGLGDKLKEKGYQVVYAFSDYLPIYTYNLDLKDKYYVFSDYFYQNEKTAVIPREYLHINWWKTFFSDYDRMIVHNKQKVFNKEYYYCLISNLVCFFDHIFKENSIDSFIYENISNSFAYTCFEVAKVNNVSYRGYISSRLPNRFELDTEEFGIKDHFKKEFDKIKLSDVNSDLLKEINQYLSKYNGDDIPSYHPKNSPLTADYSLSRRYINKDKGTLLKGAFAYCKKQRKYFKYSYQTQNPLSSYYSLFKRQIIKKIRYLNGNNLFESPIEGEKYFLFPLQMKPESSTSVLARHYCDDIAVIKNIAFNIPFGYKLYVKEHFVNYGNLPFSYYKELRKIPNVRLIHSSENTMNLVRNCKALITLTSTMGFEALLLNKKVIAFGNVFYECHPNCIKLNNYDNLFEILSNINNVKYDIETNEINKRFLAAYYNVTYPGGLIFFLYKNEDMDRFTIPLINAMESYDQNKISY